MEIFDIQKKDIEKIGLSTIKEKRLDFKAFVNGSEIQIETKGTTYKNNVKSMIKDVHAKKEGKNNIANKFGFVTLLSKAGKSESAKVYATDPLVEGNESHFKGIYKFINYYLIYFSFILDNVEYNKIHQLLYNQRKIRKNTIKIQKIEYSFLYKDRQYMGQCFDKRLLLRFIDKYINDEDTSASLFSKLTDTVGKEKYFLGIDTNILKNINNSNVTFLSNYNSPNTYDIQKGYEYIQMSDGILLIISRNAALPEMEEKFTEEKVKKRLNNFQSFIQHRPHECGASCRSRGIEGKPCEILTYRGHCRYHR